MSWYFAAGAKENTVYFSDEELQEIYDMNEPNDRYGVEQEILKRIKAKRPNENIYLHVYSLDPLVIDAIASASENPDFWKEK